MSKLLPGAFAALLLLHAPHALAETASTDLFGFTEGTDIAEPGEIGLTFGIEAGFVRRPGPFTGLTGTLEATIGISDWLEFTPALSFSNTRFFEEDLDRARSVAGFAAFSPAFKLRLLDRAQAPVGLALKVEPSLNWLEEGARGFGYGSGFALMLDREIVPELFYGALNLTYEFSRFRPRGLDDDGVRLPWESFSELGVSAALSTRVRDSFFLGAEAAYLRSYEGTGLNRFAGEAIYVGPTFYMPLTENVELAGTVSTQVWGREAGGNGRLDLGNFERHRAKLSLAVSF